MSWIKNLSDYAYTEMAIEGEEYLKVYTDDRFYRGNKPCNWFYRVAADHPFDGDTLKLNENFGYAHLCGCDECARYGSKVFEHFAFSLALRWIRDNCNSKRVDAWVVSEELLWDATDGFALYDGRFTCPFLRTLNEDISALVHELHVNVRSYSEYD